MNEDWERDAEWMDSREREQAHEEYVNR